MGYRNYIARINKEDYVKSRLIDDEEYRHDKTEDLHEIGKYYDSPEEDWEVIDDFSGEEDEYVVITLESLKSIIKQYANNHLTYLKKLDEENEFGEVVTSKNYVEGQIRQWSQAESLVYNIDCSDDELVNSWSYEYTIFDLVRIYKTFDSENYYLIYRGG